MPDRGKIPSGGLRELRRDKQRAQSAAESLVGFFQKHRLRPRRGCRRVNTRFTRIRAFSARRFPGGNAANLSRRPRCKSSRSAAHSHVGDLVSRKKASRMNSGLQSAQVDDVPPPVNGMINPPHKIIAWFVGIMLK